MTQSIISIRHGESEYTGAPNDITLKGFKQIIDTAESLRNYLKSFDCVVIISSPANRATTSAEVFIKYLGLSSVVHFSRSVGSIKHHDREKFFEFMHSFPDESYEETWLNNTLLAEENAFAESREKVKVRSLKFIRKYSNWLTKFALENNKRVCLIAFSHFEVNINYLLPLLADLRSSEIVIGNAEPIIMEIIDLEKQIYKIKSRNEEARVQIDQESGSLKLIDLNKV